MPNKAQIAIIVAGRVPALRGDVYLAEHVNAGWTTVALSADGKARDQAVASEPERTAAE